MMNICTININFYRRINFLIPLIVLGLIEMIKKNVMDNGNKSRVDKNKPLLGSISNLILWLKKKLKFNWFTSGKIF